MCYSQLAIGQLAIYIFRTLEWRILRYDEYLVTVGTNVTIILYYGEHLHKMEQALSFLAFLHFLTKLDLAFNL